MWKKNDFDLFDILHKTKPKSSENEEKDERRVTYIKRSNKCNNCFSRLFYDRFRAMKICQRCGCCYNYQNEFDEMCHYYTTHRKKTQKRYYKEYKMLNKRLSMCDKLTVKDRSKIIVLFEKNIDVIKKAYKDNKKSNFDYNFLANKFVAYCGLSQYSDQYYPINRTKATKKIYDNIWANISNNMIK